MRQQFRHCSADHPLDAYFTPVEAVLSLLRLEAGHLPHTIWEPAAGDGAISRPLQDAGHIVFSTDIADYGWDGCLTGLDYLKASPIPAEGIVTNPPFKLAASFAAKALGEAGYVALLLRTNFLESTRRLPFFREHPPSRIWVSSRRLPMMHRHGWDGKKAGSNTCHAWFIWQRSADEDCRVGWFDWKEIVIGIPASLPARARRRIPPNNQRRM